MSDRYPERTVYSFDTFTGIPCYDQHLNTNVLGEFSDVNYDHLVKRLNGKNIKLFRGIFPNTVT